MTTQTATPRLFSSADINALFAPLHPRRSSVEVYEDSRAILIDKRLATAEMFDGFANCLPPDGTPVLFVPPQPKAVNKLDWAELMARINLNGKTGRNYLTIESLSDLDPIVTTPRMLISVEDGRGRLNTKPSVSETAIMAAGWFGYNLWTGFIHAVVYTKVLNHHYLDLVRSRYDADCVPCLYLHDGVPALRAHWNARASPGWGAPSFGSVIEG